MSENYIQSINSLQHSAIATVSYMSIMCIQTILSYSEIIPSELQDSKATNYY